MCELIFLVLFVTKTKSYLSVADEKGQEAAEAAEGPLINYTPLEDNHLPATVKFFPETDYDYEDYEIFLESFSKKVKIECNLNPPYMPFGCDGPQITMSTAIDLLNR